MSHSGLALSLSVLAFLGASLAPSQETIPSDQLDFFEAHVRPALVKYCYECHSQEAGESRGGLYLDTRAGMAEGGSSGSILEGGEKFDPLFIDAITWADSDYEMPPKKKMPEEVIAKLVEWVEMGAPDPRERETFHVESKIDYEEGRKHWAYQRPRRSIEKSIDAIVAKKRAAEGLKPVDVADATSLLRRLSFDLTGLPPTPPEIARFVEAVEQNRGAAITGKIDELLASEHYGERWGRHWLDVVRYGESAGTMNVVYPYAWRFRNYVIDSFNEDKPFDRLLSEHLAGDLLPAASEAEKQENLIATGFLAVGPKKQNEKNRAAFRANLIDEQIDTTTRAFIGTTVACARCHDHKFDPISTGDYYAMAGIFGSTETLWGTIAGNQNFRVTELQPLPIADKGMGTKNQGNLYEEKKTQLAALIARNNELRGRTGGKGKGGKGGKGAANSEMLEASGMTQKDLVRLKQQILRLQSELKFLNPDGTAQTFAMGAREGRITDSPILVTGDVNKPAQVVERGFPEVLDFSGIPAIPDGASGRLELAEWITSENNPLTARVMVNRIWLHLTGAPIVETMDNFGSTGLPPSNPELLDYLAIRFMESGWSVKKLVREIMLSEVYQLAATYDETSYAKDPANETHWRANPRQLDAEALRDQMLVVSGLLDRTRPETSFAHEIGDSRLTAAKSGRSAVDLFDTASFKGRSIYLPILREALPDELGLFDTPDPAGTVGQRATTNVAPQSLHLMNSDLVQRQARAMAEVLERNFKTTREQVSKAFLLAYSRPASEIEVNRSLEFLRDFDPGNPPATEPSADRGVADGPSPSMAESDAVPKGKQGKGKGAKGGKGKGSRGAKGGKRAPPAEAEIPPTEEQAKLAAFCQALMMSAEFRMIH